MPLALAGCAGLSPDGGMGAVQAIAADGIKQTVVKIDTDDDARIAEARSRQLLAKPLTANSAVQIALLNNKGLQAAYNELAVTEARGVEASLPPSPTLSISRLSASMQLEIERQILVNVLGLLTLPAKRDIAETQFRQAQFKAAQETLSVAAETRRAYYRAVASRQSIALLQEAKAGAEAASELTKKLGESGAVSKLDQAREHVFYAEITGELARAKQTHEADRERLIRAIGLWGKNAGFTLPGGLQPLPGKVRALRDIEAEALKRRVDVEMARIEVEATAKSFGLTNATRFVNALEVAGKSKYERATTVGDTGDRDTEKTRSHGAELEIQVPLFDFGETRTREAEETYKQAVNRLAEKAINARSEVREAYQRYRGAYDFSRHYRNEIVPLRQTIAEESLLRYNGMLTDIFPVLTDARSRIASNSAAIEALRDFWLAEADLQMALIGGGAPGGGPETRPATVAAGGGEAAH
jgi:outer membrane protein TolC